MRITTSFAYIAVAVIAVTASPISAAETPQKALSLVQEYENRKAAAYRTAEESLKTHWTQLMDGLRALQMQYSREGRLNEAIAIRDIVKRLFAERGERVLAIALSRSHSDGEKEINVLIEEMTREGLLDEAVALRGKYTARMANHDLEKKGIVIIDDPGSPGQLGLGPGSGVRSRDRPFARRRDLGHRYLHDGLVACDGGGARGDSANRRVRHRQGYHQTGPEIISRNLAQRRYHRIMGALRDELRGAPGETLTPTGRLPWIILSASGYGSSTTRHI